MGDMMRYMILFAVLTILLVAACTQQPVQEQNQNSASQESINPGSIGIETTPETKPTENPLVTPPVTEGNPSGISLSDLSSHKSQNDCWVAYQGKVYDVTAFLPLHPGGPAAILKYCGTASEFETGFTNKHGTSKVNILLQQIYKGDLV
jgi:cytochrome b involved in lipid metabolism